MTVPQPIAHLSKSNSEPERSWLAQLRLGLAFKDGKTRLIDNTHLGPLRVQRPFYPESADCCHIYLLHPPGGLVLGDLLQITVSLEPGANALMTTPSAGKVYNVNRLKPLQQQQIQLQVKANASIEWLPQETIVFDGANARLHTRLDLQDASARGLLWDIVCLGRPAAGEVFQQGRCDQTLEVVREGRLILLERNRFIGGSDLLRARWGLNQGNTSGTFLATVTPSREWVDALLAELAALGPAAEHNWGLTQKDELFIARYLGKSARVCKLGFERIWQALRPLFSGHEVCKPRIWHT